MEQKEIIKEITEETKRNINIILENKNEIQEDNLKKEILKQIDFMKMMINESL